MQNTLHIFLKTSAKNSTNNAIDMKKIRNLMTALLKSKEVEEIKRFNYIASYTLQDNKLIKQQEKSLLLIGIKNQEKILTMIEKIIGKNYQIID